MKSLSDYFSKFFSVRPSDGDVGIEIETETVSLGDYPPGFLTTSENPQTGHIYWKLPMKFWVGHKDGSLRNFGVEFVLEKPLSFEDAKKALAEFAEISKKIKFIPSPPSTSVHVHLNFSKKTLVEIGNFLTLWVLFENVLVEFCGETRRSNLFALPCRVAEGVCGFIVDMFSGIDSGEYTALNRDPSVTKYGAVNIATLPTIGSIELRCFRGTTQAPEIQEWVNILEELYNFSLQPGLTPPDIIQAYRNSEVEFFYNVFPKTGKILANDLNIEAYIERNLWYACDIANCVSNWETLGENLPTNKTAARKKKSDNHLDMSLTEIAELYNTPTPIPSAVHGNSLNSFVIDDEIPQPSIWNTTYIPVDDMDFITTEEEES